VAGVEFPAEQDEISEDFLGRGPDGYGHEAIRLRRQSLRHFGYWSERRDLNSGPPVPQTNILNRAGKE
jgi:hypothetical protein